MCGHQLRNSHVNLILRAWRKFAPERLPTEDRYSMKKRLLFTALSALLLLVSVSPRPAQAAVELTRIVVGCRTFLVAGHFALAPGVQFTVTVTDVLGKTVYSKYAIVSNSPDSKVHAGNYGGYGGPFTGQPAQGPIRVVIKADQDTIADLSADYPSLDSCGMFNWRPDASFVDGRLNLADPWESVAIYCYADGTLSVLRPRYPGDLASPEVIRLTQRQLSLYPQKPAQNILLRNKSDVQLYLLTSGELEIVATTREPDKLYKFILGGC
jgi:hypothetical protein